LLSQTSLGKDVKGEEYKALVKRIQFGGDEVVQAKAGTGSATLSMGYGEFPPRRTLRSGLLLIS
jgi:malate dehydrogenase